MGALKSWAVSGELLGTSSTNFLGVKVKWREVGNLHFSAYTGYMIVYASLDVGGTEAGQRPEHGAANSGNMPRTIKPPRAD